MDSLSEDNTAVLEMKKDFLKVCAPSASKIRSHLSFDISDRSMMSEGNRTGQGSLSMQRLLEKEREEKEKQADLIHAKVQINHLQDKINSLETSRKRARVEYEKEIETVKHTCMKETNQLTRLKEQMNMILIKEENARKSLKETRDELSQVKSTFEQRLVTLQRAKYTLEMQYQELEQKSSQREMELKNDNFRKDSELAIRNSDLEQINQKLQNALKRCTDLSNQLQEYQEQQIKALASEQRVKELEKQLSQLDSDAAVTRNLREQLDRVRDLEKENRTLRSENTYHKETQDNVFLLKEENNSLKQKLDRVQNRCKEYDRLELENKDMTEKLMKWERLTDGGSTRPISADELTRRVVDLQSSNSSLLERQGHLQTSAHALEENMKLKDGKIREMLDQLTQNQLREHEQEQLIRRLKKKLLLVAKERDSYKGILDSYENEITSNVRSPGGSQANQLKKLGETLLGYQRNMESLETETDNMSKQLLQAQTSAKLLENELKMTRQQQRQRVPSVVEADSTVITQLRDQVASLEKSLEEITEAKCNLEDRLERRHLQGDFDPVSTKILHFTMNPSALAQQHRAEEVGLLKEENKKLKARVELLEENEGRMEDMTCKVEAKVDSGPSNKEIEDLQNQIKAAELKNQRLMEAFKKKSHDWREAVYQLLGYMVQTPCENQYRLMNVYAESPNDYLLFQQDPEGQLQMLATDYSLTLEEKIDTYLNSGNSIPAFLSSVTLELFSRQTIMQT